MANPVDIQMALMERIETLSIVPAPTLVFPGFPASKDDYWMRITHLPNVPDRGSLDGSVSLDHMGILHLDLMCEIGQHEIVYLQRAQDVIDHFPQTLLITSYSTVVKIVKSYMLGGRATGDHWMIPVRVEYVAK